MSETVLNICVKKVIAVVWFAGGEKRSAAMLFGRTLASITKEQRVDAATSEDSPATETETVAVIAEPISPSDTEKFTAATAFGMFSYTVYLSVQLSFYC